MQTPPSHENMRRRMTRSTPRRSAESSVQVGSAILTEESAALEVAIELIEMRYREYRARMEMEALFTEGKLNCV